MVAVGTLMLLLAVALLSGGVLALASFDRSLGEEGHSQDNPRPRSTRWWSLPWLGGPGDQ